MEHIYRLPLMGGPWDGEFLITLDSFGGTLVFSLKGFTGYYDINGYWRDVA